MWPQSLWPQSGVFAILLPGFVDRNSTLSLTLTLALTLIPIRIRIPILYPYPYPYPYRILVLTLILILVLTLTWTTRADGDASMLKAAIPLKTVHHGRYARPRYISKLRAAT